MSPNSPPLRWTLEAPDRGNEHFPRLVDAKAYLAGLNADNPKVTLRRVARGCYRYDPPITRAPVPVLGPWLLYNAWGARYLTALEQLILPYTPPGPPGHVTRSPDGV